MAGKNVVTLNDLNFESEVLKSDKPVLIDFTATWCGPCKMIAPMIDELADETAGTYKVAKLDIDEAPATAAKFGIKGVPTMVVVKAGKETARHAGANTSKAKLKAMLG
ncbi:MAG: thioredoxin [Myxococcales bacterium]|nr:thioredoxin [Myxococcales bacterium]MBL8716308.1 thioredoxin [Myxococcales bacterium]